MQNIKFTAKSAASLFCQAAGLGLIAGMRTFMAPAVASHIYSRHPTKHLRHTPLKFMQTIIASKVFKVLAGAELIGDKMPNAPNRTDAPGLTGRTLSGILVGATVYKASGKQALIGGLIGGAAAVASTFGCFFLRRAISRRKYLPDAVVGGMEDVLTIAIGAGIAKSA